MDSQTLWKRFCSSFQFYPSLGLSLDVSRMRFPDDFFAKMKAPMDKAFKNMNALEKGEIVNPDEQRMVGHYWLRAPELSPTAELKESIAGSIQQIKDFAAKVHKGEIKPEKAPSFKNVLLIGIGGSALGPQLVSDALGTRNDKMRIFFCDNTDPDGISRILTQLGEGLAETISIVVSKSGGTIETRNGQLEAETAYKAKGLTFSKHVLAVTCPGSKLDEMAKKLGWLPALYMWDWVGGRTSLFSAVGLVPAALQGLNIDEFIAGANEMDQITRAEDATTNPAALLAQMWHFAGDGKGKKDMVVLPYKDRLVLFSKYLQQLVMESLGKEKDLDGNTANQGIAVYGNKGSTDQHAYVQQLRDGVNNFFVTFVEVLSDYTIDGKPQNILEVEPGVTSGDYLSGFYLGTRRALFENNRDSITITVDTLTPKTLGGLIALFDRAVGYYASLVNINAYHQPGVEAGKKAAAKIIDLQNAVLKNLSSNPSPRTALELAQAIGSADEAETVFKILEHLSANPHRGVRREGTRHPLEAKYALG